MGKNLVDLDKEHTPWSMVGDRKIWAKFIAEVGAHGRHGERQWEECRVDMPK
jgi:hypothetical protein